MRLAILHTRMSGYFIACLRTLQARTEVELLVFAWPNQHDAPFDDALFEGIGTVYSRADFDVPAILDKLETFEPDVVLTGGWYDKGYVAVDRKFKARGIPVIAGSDTQWKGSFRQRVAAVLSPWTLKRSIDVMWVSGDRQKRLANKLGFSGDRCWEGYYSCDWDRFSAVAASGARGAEVGGQRSFLFVGRYTEVKGLDTLAQAYRSYCSRVKYPWKLICAGRGEYARALVDAGAEDRGFIQPDQLPELMGEASAFILPSRFEPWGVVVHEAAAAGLPLIVSDACGVGDHLLRNGENGYLFRAGDVEELMQAMLKLHDAKDETLQDMGTQSYELSKQYTPQLWCNSLLAGIRDLGIHV